MVSFGKFTKMIFFFQRVEYYTLSMDEVRKKPFSESKE